ncbi:PilZ domain-containing protein [Marinicella sp. W31]|uniref:PilZ domain-containing protein n=1 Tax=Marinicella sp. W31 TaxID=3023713 RepID=UPI003756A836
MNAAVFDGGSLQRETRWYLEEFIDVIELETDEHIGHLLDISEHGIGMVCKQKLMMNQPMHLRLVRRISNAAGCKQFIDVLAVPKWFSPQKKNNFFNMGFRIKVTDKKSKIRLDQWLRKLEQAHLAE